MSPVLHPVCPSHNYFCISYCRQMPLGIHIPAKSIILKTIENDKLLLLHSLHGAYGMWQPPCFLQRNSAEKSLGCPNHWSVELRKASCLKLNKGHDKNGEWQASALFIMKPPIPEEIGVGGGGTQQDSKVQPLALLYTIFDRKGAPFVYLLLTNGTPVIY